MKITYCDGWFRARHRPGEIWDEARARKAYEERKLYAALIGDPQRPDCFVESNMDYIGVEFLDSNLRTHLGYTFVEKEPRKLFMVAMTTHYYERDTSEITSG